MCLPDSVNVDNVGPDNDTIKCFLHCRMATAKIVPISTAEIVASLAQLSFRMIDQKLSHIDTISHHE